MKTPRDQSTATKIAKYLNGFYSGWFNKILINLIVVSPPAVIATLYSNKDIKDFIKILTSENTYNYIASVGKGHVILFNLFAFLWPVILITAGAEIKRLSESNGLSVDKLLALIKSLDSIVGIKNTRFHAHVKDIATLSKETAFETITNPQAQISEIVKEIGIYFNAIGEKKSSLIRVSLAVIKNGQIIDIPIFYPNDEPIKSTIASLNSPNSGFINALKSKRIFIISDIKKELKKPLAKRKFAETENEEDNNGSIICYPVKVFDSSIPFVLSIHSDESGYFKEEFKEVYDHTLQRFGLRLSVENSLLIMKEELCG